jgi:hypothetical protein
MVFTPEGFNFDEFKSGWGEGLYEKHIVATLGTTSAFA